METRLVLADRRVGQRGVITVMDIFALPDSLQDAWKVICGR